MWELIKLESVVRRVGVLVEKVFVVKLVMRVLDMRLTRLAELELELTAPESRIVELNSECVTEVDAVAVEVETVEPLIEV